MGGRARDRIDQAERDLKHVDNDVAGGLREDHLRRRASG